MISHLLATLSAHFADQLAPDERDRRRDLGAQTRLAVTAASALEIVRDAWRSAAK